MSSEFDRLYRRIVGLVGRGRLKTIDDSGSVQLGQVDLGPKGTDGSPLQLRDKTSILGLFGLASRPPTDSDCVVLFVGGSRERAVVLGHGHQASRFKNLGVGDSALYDVRGAYVWLKPTGLVIDAAGLNVTIQNANNINITAVGTVTVTAPHVTVSSNDVNLGGTGGAAVARVGDTVSGGVITGGSSHVKAI